MVKFFICISSIIILISCKSKNTPDSPDHSHDSDTTTGAWTEQYKKTFLEQCITGGTANFFAGDSVKAKAYCGCMLEKMQKEYPNTKVLDNMTMAQMQERMQNMVNDCLPK